MSISLARALISLVPKAEFEIVGENYENIRWLDSRPIPSKEQVLEEIRLVEIREKRAKEYPSIGDQLDALYHAGVFPEEIALKIKAVKEKYPKE